jgi:prepilin-type N-terminal cleavage/methylation domain-containing protein
MRALSKKSKRGFTLLEMMTSVFIIGLILLLIGYEFDGALNKLLHNQSNRDLESNARVVMTKVTNRLRAATVDPQLPTSPGCNPCADDVILSPNGTSNTLSFIRVRPGSLTNPASIPVDKNNNPIPPYDIVTIQIGTGAGVGPLADKLIETDVDPTTKAVISTETLGDHVTAFQVDNHGTSKNGAVDVTITTSSYSSRCYQNCNFTMTNSVYVGGTTLQ